MSTSVNHPTFCRGGGGTCECEEFRWRDDGKPICHECDHGISKHRTIASQPPPPPPPPDPSPSLHTSTRTVPTIPQPTVLGIFSNLTERDVKPDRLLLTQTEAKARAEAIATFGSQKPKGSVVPRVTSGTRKASTTGATNRSRLPSGSSSHQAGSNSSTIFHVSSIGMVVCGIGRGGHLKRPRAPFGKMFASEVQAMKNRGCFVTTSGPSDGVAVNAAWTFAQVNDQVHQWFPQVFVYLDSVRTQTSSKSSHQSVQPEWLVLVRSGSQFSLVEVTEPNGSTLYENKGRSKAGIADSMLWFVTRKAIPDSVYDSWNKEPVIIGSDSEDEIDSSITTDDKKSRDDIISIGSTNSPGSDVDIKLTSSLLDLNLYDDSAVASKDKGKDPEKYTDPVTPPKKSGKRSRMLRSPIQSPPAVKKRRDVSSNAIPLFFKSSPPPQISSVPENVPVSQGDVILRGRHYPDSPNAPRNTNPWSSDYTLMSFNEFYSFLQ